MLACGLVTQSRLASLFWLLLCFAALLPSLSCTQAALSPRGRAPGGRNVSLRYEGTCAHLACCSVHAVPVAPNTRGAFACGAQAGLRCGSSKQGWFAPGFTCNPHEPGKYRKPHDPPYLSCDDQERWLALPELTHAHCGEPYLVCYRGRRVIARARDRSAPNGSGKVHHEASLGLLLALGADPRERETIVSIYALHERDRIAADPHCVGDAAPAWYARDQ